MCSLADRGLCAPGLRPCAPRPRRRRWWTAPLALRRLRAPNGAVAGPSGAHLLPPPGPDGGRSDRCTAWGQGTPVHHPSNGCSPVTSRVLARRMRTAPFDRTLATRHDGGAPLPHLVGPRPRELAAPRGSLLSGTLAPGLTWLARPCSEPVQSRSGLDLATPVWYNSGMHPRSASVVGLDASHQAHYKPNRQSGALPVKT